TASSRAAAAWISISASPSSRHPTRAARSPRRMALPLPVLPGSVHACSGREGLSCVVQVPAMPLQPDFAKRGGFVPAIAQDATTGQVLMVAYMNDAAWRHTLATGKATYWSTSRNELWVKGDTSGHVQWVKEILIDCDEDCVLLKVEQVGGIACHKGYQACF